MASVRSEPREMAFDVSARAVLDRSEGGDVFAVHFHRRRRGLPALPALPAARGSGGRLSYPVPSATASKNSA